MEHEINSQLIFQVHGAEEFLLLLGGVAQGAVRLVGEADVQVVACRVGAYGVIQPIVGSGTMVAGCGECEQQHRQEDGKAVECLHRRMIFLQR